MKNKEGVFKIIALQTHDISSYSIKDKERRTAAENIYKVLQPRETYNFLSDYRVSEYGESTFWIEAPASESDVYGNTTAKTQIEISAIVGENGSGKSSIIELMVRVINNLACHLIGEYRISLSADNLLYCENVYATLFFINDNKAYALEAAGKQVTLRQKAIGRNEPDVPNTRTWVYDTFDKPIDPDPEQINVLKKLFYTIVSNYSLYAFNPFDIRTDRCSPTKVEKIHQHNVEKFSSNKKRAAERLKQNFKRFAPPISQIDSLSEWDRIDIERRVEKSIEAEIERLIPKPTNEEHYWLHGLFFKNDGYTTPIVLSPFRNKGNIDINTENDLNLNRLLTLLVYKNQDNKYPFRVINNKTVRAVLLTHNYEKRFKIWGEIFTDPDNGVGLPHVDPEIRKYVHQSIIRQYSSRIGNASPQLSDPEKEHAWYYLVYKTLRISRNYTPFEALYSMLNVSVWDSGDPNKKVKKDKFKAQLKKVIPALIDNILTDESHVSQKVRKTLAYLKLGHFKLGAYALQDLDSKIQFPEDATFFDRTIDTDRYDKEQLSYKTKDGTIRQFRDIELMPPPLFKVDFNLHHTSDTELKVPIAFSSLSSGERQQVYFTNSVLYHLTNLESAHGHGTETVTYRSVCAVFEEIELYFHPERQRQLVANLIDSIRNAGLKHIKSVHLIFATHSPFILSDIPAKNCLFLPKDQNREKSETFGANIHDILRWSFFLKKGAMGDYAQRYIDRLIATLNYHFFEQELNKDRKNDRTHYYLDNARNKIKDVGQIEPLTDVEPMIELIDEPIIKAKLREMYALIDPENDKKQ